MSSDVSTMCWHLPTLAQHIYRDFAYWLSTCMYKVHALNAGLLQDKSFNLIYCYAAKDYVECKNARTNADKKLEKNSFPRN